MIQEILAMIAYFARFRFATEKGKISEYPDETN